MIFSYVNGGSANWNSEHDWGKHSKKPMKPIQLVEVDIVPLSEASHILRPDVENNVIPF